MSHLSIPLEDWTPKVSPDAFVAPDVTLIGDVTIGSESTVWPGAVLRGDDGFIRVGRLSSIQDGTVVHNTEGLSTTTVGDRGAFQIELARADLTLRAYQALMERELATAMEIARSGDGSLPERDRLRVEGSLSHATESVIQAAMRLFPFAGAGALHLSSPIQRALRDLIGSGQHYVASNLQIEEWGKALLETEPT